MRTESAAIDDVLNSKEVGDIPQPKWTVFRILNFVVLAVFVSTVGFVSWNYRQLTIKGTQNFSSQTSFPITNIYFPVMFIICLCLVYFFAFFGISFLDTDDISKNPTNFVPAEVAKAAAVTAAISKSGVKKRNKSVSFDESANPIAKLAARHNTPTCAERVAAQIAAAALSETPTNFDYPNMSDEDVFAHLKVGTLKDYELEKKLGNYERAVCLRRQLYELILGKKMDSIPYTNYNYERVYGANCEIVIGYVPLPVGIVGPLLVNSEPIYVPMATTEGCLVASTNRGCKAITASGGCFATVLKDAITRAPCVKLPNAMRAASLKKWIEVPENYHMIETAFNSTTSFGRLDSVDATVAGRNVFLRFCCMSGDAMGMNMVSKGCLKAMEILQLQFPDMTLVAISGNMCCDKKPSAVNWILGRGKSVVVEAVIPEKIVKSVLKCTVHDMIETNKQKNHIGSAMAGSVGGFNAHAANILTAVYLATGQDPAQNVESSTCITIMDFAEDGKSLQISVTMPSIEVGTVGGGTHLPAQAGCLEMMGVNGAAKAPAQPGDNAKQLAKIVGASVLAGELSLMAALAANHLVRSHMQHNRKPSESTSQSATAVDSMRKTNSSSSLSSQSKME